MRRLTWMVLVLAGTGLGCSESHSGDDGGITFDATLPDGGPTDLCPNGRLDPGEMCDDGNSTAGDGCDPTCQREPFCGDRTVDSGEVCDDGNNRSGDGCRSDCMSDESCGNGVVDFAVGEVCDGTAGCGMDCMSASGCGDGAVTAPEQCENDPPNSDPWDGCDAACQDEIVLVMNSLSLAGRTVGCDFNGDGTPDNAFARALGLLSSFIGPAITQAIDNRSILLLLAFQGLDDPAAANDDDFRIAWLQAQDADDPANPANDFAGAGEFLVDSTALNADGSPLTSLQSSVAMSNLHGGPEDIPLPLPGFPIELQQGRVEGRTTASGGRVFEIQDGLLCGGVSTSLFVLIGGLAGDMLMPDPPCDGGAPAELLDVIIAGGTINVPMGGGVLPLRFTATRPDLDLDHDGLEGYEVQNGAGCQAVVTACTDGDGTRIEGRSCFSDPRMADGFSAAFEFSAIQATAVGTTGAMMPPPPPPPGG